MSQTGVGNLVSRTLRLAAYTARYPIDTRQAAESFVRAMPAHVRFIEFHRARLRSLPGTGSPAFAAWKQKYFSAVEDYAEQFYSIEAEIEKGARAAIADGAEIQIAHVAVTPVSKEQDIGLGAAPLVVLAIVGPLAAALAYVVDAAIVGIRQILISRSAINAIASDPEALKILAASTDIVPSPASDRAGSPLQALKELAVPIAIIAALAFIVVNYKGYTT
jgi:hypothetical protein